MINESISCKEKLHVVFNTNERNFPIVNLALKYFCHHNSPDGFNVSVIANKLPKTDLLYTDRVNYISGDIGFCPSGTHFGTTITKALNQIKEEFIFFFCDDYILTKHIDLKKLNVLLSMIEKEQIDYFSFASSDPERFNFKKYDVKDVYDIEKDKFYIIPPDFRHAYSVQPCIWKKSSLQELLKHNPNLTLHAMDNSSIADKSGYYRKLKDDVLSTFLPSRIGLSCPSRIDISWIGLHLLVFRVKLILFLLKELLRIYKYGFGLTAHLQEETPFVSRFVKPIKSIESKSLFSDFNSDLPVTKHPLFCGLILEIQSKILKGSSFEVKFSVGYPTGNAPE